LCDFGLDVGDAIVVVVASPLGVAAEGCFAAPPSTSIPSLVVAPARVGCVVDSAAAEAEPSAVTAWCSLAIPGAALEEAEEELDVASLVPLILASNDADSAYMREESYKKRPAAVYNK
jgi:hypothetical protein